MDTCLETVPERCEFEPPAGNAGILSSRSFPFTSVLLLLRRLRSLDLAEQLSDLGSRCSSGTLNPLCECIPLSDLLVSFPTRESLSKL
ncbi:hypothetical protein T07_12937 [Trichinella nelsoni]|uniref:Uncharacterized protein n=1 Tax=Trichinella nelsoni TaxID=6336 RepID=A0A0V0S3R6_9BILA|nr:hypothetical protein T07_12937 [Trichinella nelsoni]